MGQDRRTHDETGAATLEYTGVMAAAAILVLALLLAATTAAPGVGERFRWALCKITTLGQGECGSPTSAAQHRPKEPCVMASESQAVRRDLAALIITTADGRKYEVAKLSDGRSRVTLIADQSAGAEVSAGGGLTVTWDDRTYGGSATAEAGASLDIRAGQAWYTSDPAELARMLEEKREVTIEDGLLGGGAVRSVWEGGQDIVEPSPATATTTSPSPRRPTSRAASSLTPVPRPPASPSGPTPGLVWPRRLASAGRPTAFAPVTSRPL